jgi:ParB/RepB/Spo0J family partition protein
VSKIHPDLEALAFPVEKLTPLPGNPRRGDVAAVARSYATFGQRKPIVARREGDGGIVIAGNHQHAAAKELGWENIAVLWVDDDDLTAKAFALADNRTADLGSYDNADLLTMLQSVHDADSGLFEATAYDESALANLIEKLEIPDPAAVEIAESYAVLVDCESEADQVILLERLTEEGLKCRALVS